MADQDLNLKVVTTADTSGLSLTLEKIEELKQKSIAAGIAPDIAEQIAKAGAYFDPVKGAFVSATTEASKLTDETKKTSTEAKKLEDEASKAGIHFGRAAKEAGVLSSELLRGHVSARSLNSLLTSLGITPKIAGTVAGIAAAGVGASAVAIKLYEAFRDAAEQTGKIHEDVGNQVIELDKMADKWSEVARNATETADVTKVASETLPILNGIADKARAVSAEQISTTQRVFELLQIAARPFEALTIGVWQPFTQGLKQAQEEEEKLIASSQETAIEAVSTAQRAQVAWEKVKTGPATDAFAELTNQIQAYRTAQARVDVTTPGADLPGRIAEFQFYGQRIGEVANEIKALSEIEKEREEAHRLLFPGVDDDLYKIRQIKDELQAMGVQTQNLNLAFSQGLSTVGPLGEKIRSLVLELLTAQNAQSKILTGDLFKGPVTAFEDSLKRQQEFQAHVASQRELAAEGIGEEVSAAEKKKFFQEDELRQLQRKQALQRSLIPEGETPYGAEALKRLGKEGLREFEERARRINELQQQVGNVPRQESQAQSDVAQAIRDNTAAWKAALALWQ